MAKAKNQTFIPLLLIFFLFSGCYPFDGSGETEPGTRIPDEGLTLKFVESVDRDRDISEHSAPHPELRLVLITNEIMNCYNYVIDHDIHLTGDDPRVIEIVLKEVRLPGNMCLTALGPAKAGVSLDDWDGSGELRIRDGDLEDRYHLDISHEKATAAKVHARFTEFEDVRYYLRPPDSFYFRCGTRQELSWYCEDFHNQLVDEPGIRSFEFPDDGSLPYPEKSSGNEYNAPTRFYRYEEDSDFHRAGELLELFTKEEIGQAQGNSLSVINWLDEGYRSWQFQD